MKFFVSGQVNDAANARSIMDSVRSAGHDITHDWTAAEAFLGGPKEQINNPDESGRRARADILGVLTCDVYILSSDNEQVGKGMYVELGAALALREANGKPDIYIIGAMNHPSIFYFHPEVVRVPSITDVLGKYIVT